MNVRPAASMISLPSCVQLCMEKDAMLLPGLARFMVTSTTPPSASTWTRMVPVAVQTSSTPSRSYWEDRIFSSTVNSMRGLALAGHTGRHPGTLFTRTSLESPCWKHIRTVSLSVICGFPNGSAKSSSECSSAIWLGVCHMCVFSSR